MTVGDFPTASRRVRVEVAYNGHWKGKDLEGMIQALADDGYDYLGKIDEFVPTGVCALPSTTHLFAKLAP